MFLKRRLTIFRFSKSLKKQTKQPPQNPEKRFVTSLDSFDSGIEDQSSATAYVRKRKQMDKILNLDTVIFPKSEAESRPSHNYVIQKNDFMLLRRKLREEQNEQFDRMKKENSQFKFLKTLQDKSLVDLHKPRFIPKEVMKEDQLPSFRDFEFLQQMNDVPSLTDFFSKEHQFLLMVSNRRKVTLSY